MSAVDPLVLDLVEWVADQPRAHADVMDTWRTSCPRLTVWEEALERGFVRRTTIDGRGYVVITPAGQRLLQASGRGHPVCANVMAHRAAE
jgi:hypothetical protein